MEGLTKVFCAPEMSKRARFDLGGMANMRIYLKEAVYVWVLVGFGCLRMGYNHDTELSGSFEAVEFNCLSNCHILKANCATWRWLWLAGLLV